MNIEQWENKMIAYLEGDLNGGEAELLFNAISENTALKEMWNSYKSMYASFDLVEKDQPCLDATSRFQQFLDKESATIQSTVSSKPSTRTLFPWKKLMSIAAVMIGALAIWNFSGPNNSLDQSNSSKYAFEQSLQAPSSTERIKAIRVNYNGSEDPVDDQMIELLSNVLLFDESSNVRLAAAESLLNYTANENVREVMIKALGQEQDGFVKLALIKALSQQFDDQISNTFENMVRDDSNQKFIKDEVRKELFKHQKMEI